ncbi:MAG TPA: hypothetical protein VKZ53_24690 [Candidatus Angelobacter sp.]|nr:hypothetical protein [Candidatus Angelobacter sp.]
MKWIFRRLWLGTIAAAIGALFLMPGVFAGHKEHPYRHADVDIPVSLAVGVVRTPEFSTRAEWYDIMVQVEKPMPFVRMQCMMGVAPNWHTEDCSINDPLLRADWSVWDGEQMVDKGSIPNRCACKFEDKYIYKFIGSFGADADKKYVVEVKFTGDGTPLDIANPHLIIIQHRHN